ncbi:hypothetical protein GINT2_001276 [Glugoides intestinalis]
MDFNTILETVIERISSCTKFNKEQIRQSLSVFKDNKSDFLIFFNQISTAATEEAKKLYEALIKEQFPEIKDIVLGETSIGFNLNKQKYFKDILKTIYDEGESFGKSSTGEGKTIVIDYSSPNIAKIFHVGHYRTTILGNFIKNLFRTAGYKVISLNYLGDWGKQFGLVLLGFEMFGSEEELEKDALMHLFRIYVKINEEGKKDESIHEKARNIFKEMEENKNEKYLSQWRRFRELSINKYMELYKKLNIEFDVYGGESFYQERAKEFATSTEIATTDKDGARVIDCGEKGKALIQKCDGTTLYLTRDICAAMDRIKTYNAEKLFYVVSSEQDQHFQQLFTCMEKLGYTRKQFEHVNYGFVHGMSTRKGTVHFIEDIIETSSEAIKSKLLNSKKMAAEEMDETALILAISTLLVADFSAKRSKGYTFDFDQRANCEKGSGAYLQYAHCRLKSIEENNVDLEVSNGVEMENINTPEIHELAYKLLWYERILELCQEDYEPSRLVIYLMDLCKVTNNLVAKLRVKGEETEVAKARLFVFKASRIVIRNGLKVLGITPLKRM